jgi:hypothetical protein
MVRSKRFLKQRPIIRQHRAKGTVRQGYLRLGATARRTVLSTTIVVQMRVLRAA